MERASESTSSIKAVAGSRGGKEEDGEEADREDLHTRAKDDGVVGAETASDHHVQAATRISMILHKDT